MGVFAQFATNKKLETDGVPVQFEANTDGTIPTMFIRRIHRESPKYQAAFTRITKPYKFDIDQNRLPEAIDTALMQELFADQAVAGWENWRMPKDVAGGLGDAGPVSDMPFSVEAVCAVFTVLPDLWRKVAIVSADADAYKTDDLEAMAKN